MFVSCFMKLLKHFFFLIDSFKHPGNVATARVTTLRRQNYPMCHNSEDHSDNRGFIWPGQGMQTGFRHTVQLTSGPLLASKDVENFFDNLDSRTVYGEAVSKKEFILCQDTDFAGYRAPGSADSLTGSSSRDSSSSSNDNSNVKSSHSATSGFCSEIYAINSDVVGFSSDLNFIGENKMYQGGLTLPPSAAGYGQDSMANGYLHSGKWHSYLNNFHYWFFSIGVMGSELSTETLSIRGLYSLIYRTISHKGGMLSRFSIISENRVEFAFSHRRSHKGWTWYSIDRQLAPVLTKF